MKNRFTGLILAVLATAVADGKNLLKNPDFERGFESWNKPSAMWRVEDGAGYGGTKGLVWDCNDDKKYVYPVQYIPIEQGFAYRFSALVKIDSLKNASKAEVGFEWRDAKGNWVGGAYGAPVDDNGILKDGWTRYEGVSRMMKSTDVRGGFICYVRKGATGKVRFDDIVLERIPVKPINFMCTSAYHDTASDGEVNVLVSVNANPKIHSAALTVVTTSGGDRTLQPDLLTEDTAVFKVRVEELAEGVQKMLFNLMSRNDGKMIGSSEISFTRTADTSLSKSRLSFDSQHRMILDGKRFFPIGHYTGRMTDEDMEQFKRGPYNFAVQYGRMNVEHLNRWQKAGVYVAADVRSLIYGYNHSARCRFKTEDESKAELKKMVDSIGSHPALIMWYLNDEAPVSFVPNVMMAHNYLRSIDPDRATLTCLSNPETSRNFLPTFDVFAHDCYPIGNRVGRSMLERVNSQMRISKKSIASMRPLWFIPQAFDWRWYYSKEVWADCDKPYLRMPTRDEIANMTWQGIACGANGIIFYSYSPIRQHLKGKEFDNAWGDVCEVAFEIKKMEDVLLSDDVTVDYAKGCSSLPETLPVRFYRYGGKLWLLAVNARRKPVKSSIDMGSKFENRETILGGGVELSPDGSRLDINFPAMGYAFVSLTSL